MGNTDLLQKKYSKIISEINFPCADLLTQNECQ